nr:PREDICTED: integrin alpha-4 [Lepisosteus oculatus]
MQSEFFKCMCLLNRYFLISMDQKKLEEVHSWFIVLKVACFFYLVSKAECYNLDIENHVIFNGPKGSLFGYSVLLHSHENQNWLLVGAPIANSSSNQAIVNPGAIFKCNINDINHCEQLPVGIEEDNSCGRHCLAEKDNQWLGVSLSRQSEEGYIVACGHRWKNVFYMHKENQHKLPHGICYKISPDLTFQQTLTPCYKDHQRKFGESYGSCQAGISNYLTKDLIIMGAPGTFYWTGSVLVYNMSSRSLWAYVDNENHVLFGSYLGYSVGAGHFSHPDSTEFVGGAPQHGQTGKAYILSFGSTSTLEIIFELSGKMLGSYFGASVCAVDLNSDGLSDLLVGAPMHSTVREEGRVYVYMNLGKAKLQELEFELVGSDMYSARFGETITNLGDIDDDGFPDVAIGAPQEEDLQGAIYIYNGRKRGISQTFSQKITGSIIGNAFKMFGQSVSGRIDVDGNGYPDVAVGAFLSDSAIVLRTRAVVIVEVSMILPPSVNRTKPACTENGKPAVCMNVTLCFQIKGRYIPGYIGLLYNLTADVLRKEGFPYRFYFIGNGTSNGTSGKINALHNRMSCVTHQAYMRKEVRDIFTPIQFEATYQLGEHKVNKRDSSHLQDLKPILQQREGDNNIVSNKTMFARYCVWPNCSTNLRVSAGLVLPQSHKGKSYFALGNGKTIMLNVSLFNAGDDAFQAALHIRFPNMLYFIKVLDSEEKHISCEITEQEQPTVGLDCSVGNLYINSLTRVNVSFLLDVNRNSSAGDLTITVNATSDNAEDTNLQHDNFVSLVLPLRYGVDLNVHGFVSPSLFVFGEEKEGPCYSEKFNYTFSVINVGLSKSPDTKFKISLPNSLAPHPYQLFNALDIRSSLGQCHLLNVINKTDDDKCDLPKATFLEDVVFFFSKTGKRFMYCMEEDDLCLNIICEFGEMDIGKEAIVYLEVELNPSVLELSPGRAPVMRIQTTATAFPKNDPYIIKLQDNPFTTIVLEAHHDYKPRHGVGLFIISGSLLIGLVILGLLTYILWKVGFFKRKFTTEKEQQRRESWDYVDKIKDDY